MAIWLEVPRCPDDVVDGIFVPRFCVWLPLNRPAFLLGPPFGSLKNNAFAGLHNIPESANLLAGSFFSCFVQHCPQKINLAHV